MKTVQLVDIFTLLKLKGKLVYFKDLLKSGFNSVLIFNAINRTGANITKCENGYSLITFK